MTSLERADAPIPSIQLDAGDPISLLDKDYAVGEISVLYDRHSDKERELLFAVVELLPLGLEAGPNANLCKRLGSGNKHELNFRRWHVSLPSDAVKWYTDAVGGKVSVPSVDGNAESLPLKIGKLDHEPPWPSFAFESEPFWGEIPLWGNRPGGNRLNQLFALSGQATPNDLWSDTERSNARAWLQDELKFPLDLFKRPILWGSMNLVLPNPIFRAVSQRLTNDSGAEVALQLEPYPGRSIAGLEIVVEELRPAGVTIVCRRQLSGDRVLLRFPHDLRAISLDVICPTRGLLLRRGTSVFLRQIQIQMNMISGTREVHVPAFSRRSQAETYSVPIVSSDRRVNVGSSRPYSAAQLATEDRAEARRRVQSADLGLRWFKGNREHATTFVRDLIGNASKQVTIVDPYFDSESLMRFGLANATRSLGIHVLSSKMYLRDGSPEGKSRTRESLLKQSLDQVMAQDKTNILEIRVMLGEQAPIHDRFLVLDDNIWILGSSLKAFGERGTTAVRLPFAPDILADIGTQWNDAMPLNDFVAEMPPQSTAT